MVAIGVLGPITADVDGVPAELGGPRQRAVLALLLTARGATLSADRMIDDLWRGEPPPSARASLQAYVSHLRRELEPGRSRRAPGRLLVSTPPGYALRPPDEAVDAWRFERALTRARGLLAADPARARTETAAALRLWRGEAYAEFADAPWAAVEAARLDGLRLTARETHAAATLHLGRPAEAVAEAEALTREEPLREEGWRLLVLALWADGRQADALAALRRVRRELTEELGIEPGPELTALEEAILNRRWEALRVDPFTPGGVRATSGRRTSVAPAAPTPVRPSSAPPSSHGDLAPDAAAPHPPGPPTDAAAPFVGREAELAALGAAAGEAFAGAVRFVLVAGEAGAGKSRLLEQCARRLDAEGWVTALGHCPEAEGAPPAWAWEEIAGRLARHAPPDPGLADDLAPLLDPGPRAEARRASDRFRLHRACRAWFAAATRARPLALFLDDLHRADRETLALLAGLAEDPPAGRLLIVAAHRPDEGDLAAVQAVLARRAPVRLPLDGLAPPDAVRLVRALAPVGAGTAAALAERTGGNPFFLQETARMFTGGAVTADALRAVPDGVRDVLRRRFDRLPPAALSVLRLAAAAGREADVEVLVRAATAATPAVEDAVLDGLDAGLAAGLLTEPGPGRIRFAHALVRDTLYADTSGLRRARLHAALGRALRELRPDDVSAIAHHHLQAPATATARTAVEYAVRAADLAGRRYAHDTAAELLAQAAACVERHPAAFAGEDTPARLVALLGLQLQARARGGAVVEAQGVRARAMDVAERHGRDDLLVEALTAWTEPTAWERRTYAHEDTRSAAALRRLLADGSLTDAARCRLLEALAAALDSAAGPAHAGRAAAAEAVDLARGLGDPGLLAQVLATQSRVMDWECDPAPREKVLAELAQLAADHDMAAYAWLAEYLAAGTAAVRGEVASIRRHVARGLEIAETHRLSEPAAVGQVQLAALRMSEGRLDAAEQAYARAVARLRAIGSPHAAAMWTMSHFALCWLRGRPAAALPELEAAARDYGALAGDALALGLVDAGRRAEARAVRAERPPVRQDFFYSLFLSARALAVVALEERDEAPGLLDELLPLRDVVAGAASMCLAMRPVAQTLGDLARLLGRTEEAAAHYAHAAVVARRWQAPHWLADAQRARAALAPRR